MNPCSDTPGLRWWCGRKKKPAEDGQDSANPRPDAPDGGSCKSRLAEEEGFEPSYPGTPGKRFSRPPHSTTLPPLRMG